VTASILLFGILLSYLGAVPFFINPPVEPLAARLERIYSQQIETGILIVLFAITAGTLTEISRSVSP
jgi:hypothetical protein